MRTHQNLIIRRLTLVAIGIASGMLFSVRPAHAQSAEAESLFAEGGKLMANGQFAKACAAFEASNRIEPRAGTLLRLGECRERNQQLASAWSAYKDALGLATDPRKRQFATTKIAALEPRLSYLTVAVSSQARISDLAIARNDKPFDPALWNRALPVDGGDYVVTARSSGYATWQKTVHLAFEGAKLSVDVPMLTKVSRAPVPEAPRPPTPSSPPATSPAPSSPPAVSPALPSIVVPVTNHVEQKVTVNTPPASVVVVQPDRLPASSQPSSKVVPFVIGAGALALLGSGLGFELRAESTYDAAKAEMMSQQHRDSLYNSANTKRYVAQGLAAGGLAAGGAALWLYLRDGSRERDTTTSTDVHIVPTATGLLAVGQF